MMKKASVCPRVLLYNPNFGRVKRLENLLIKNLRNCDENGILRSKESSTDSIKMIAKSADRID